MVDYRELERAIAVIETKRELLGDGVVELSLHTLRAKLASLQNQSFGRQYSSITVLVADISGFTKMSELRDPELVRETINAVWERLDHVIESWGGYVDKHVGDAVIALFGVPVTRDDDAERAIQAALDMQMELMLINERTEQSTGQTHYLYTSAPRTSLGMRIAIHQGPAFFGKVGSSDEQMAVGEAVNIANQLEKMAPVRGVLVSEDVYQHVQSLFEVEPREPVVLDGKTTPTYLYVVMRERSRPFHMSIRGIEGVETRIVGRTTELQTLQDTMQETIDRGLLRVVTILGESGIGKSRLLYEFEQVINLFPERIELFRGRVHQEVGQTAYTVFRDLFSNYFDIHHRNSPPVAREKLVRGISEVMNVENEAAVQEQAHYIGQLLGFDFSDSPHLPNVVKNARQIREAAFRHIGAFFTAVSRQNSIAILFLEDMHWADEGSFDLLDYLVQTCTDVPIMIVCLARPELFEARSSWEVVEKLNPNIYERISLPTLNSIDSRHMAMDILRNVSQLPSRLIDMIVTGAEGNPFYLEELVTMLIEWNVISPSENRWQVNMRDVPPIHAPLSLSGLLEMRLERLPELERLILQKATILGQVFWDSLLVHLIRAQGTTASNQQILDSLYKLEQGAWIYRRKLSTISGVQEYAFRHDSLRVAIYASIPAEKKAEAHGRAAAWFVANQERFKRPFTTVVAYHFAQAKEYLAAAEWYGQAARYTRLHHMPETTIAYYKKALGYLSDDPAALKNQMVWNEGLAQMLRGQARLDEAATAYRAMIAAAQQNQEERVSLRGLVSLLEVVSILGDVRSVIETAEQIETLAIELDAKTERALAAVGKAWGHLVAGRVTDAIALAREGLALSQTAVSIRGVAFSQTVLANIARHTDHPKQAGQLLRRAIKQFQLAEEPSWEALLSANLAHLAQQEEQREIARSLYEDGLRLGHEISDYFVVTLCLRKLALLSQNEGAYYHAEQLFQQAMIISERSNQERYQAIIANDLGQLYLEWSSASDPGIFADVDTFVQQAFRWLHKAIYTSEHLDESLLLVQGLEILSRLQLVEKNEKAAAKSIKRGLKRLSTINQAAMTQAEQRKKQALEAALLTLQTQINAL